MTRTTPTGGHGARYSTVAIILHWLIGALILCELGLGLRMEAAHGPAKFAVFQLHKSVGITILLLAVLRLGWRLVKTPPALAARGWEQALARLVHGLFYVFLFALPLSGWLIVSTSRIVVPTLLYGTIPWPQVPGFGVMATAARDMWHAAGEFVHHKLVLVLYVLVVLHVAGALKHHLIDKDDDLARMAPGARPGAWFDPRLLAIGIGAVLAAGLGWRWLAIAGAAPMVATNAPPPPVPVQATPAPRIAANPTPASAAPPEATPAPPSATADEAAAKWTIGAGSSIAFATTWSGDPIKGGFSKFSGNVQFSPTALAKSHVDITIATASVFSGDGQRDETLKSADWFAPGSFANAVFKASDFRQTSAGHYVARGSLSIKGVTMPLTLPFTLTITGDKAVMTGSAVVDRIAYKIGEGEYAATDEIPAAVKVDVQIQATRQP